MTAREHARLRALLGALRDMAAGSGPLDADEITAAREQGRRDAYADAARELARAMREEAGR